MRIFLITAAILAAACALTYAFIAWATPISYTTIVNSDLAEKATTLTRELEKTTLAECGPLVDRFIIDTGVTVLMSDADGNPVELPNSIAISMASDSAENSVAGSYYSEEEGESLTLIPDTPTEEDRFVVTQSDPVSSEDAFSTTSAGTLTVWDTASGKIQASGDLFPVTSR